jgi:hypothetical protein
MNKQTQGLELIWNRDRTRSITAEEFDRLFDKASEEIDEFIDWDHARRVDMDIRRISVGMPVWLISRLDAEARRIGVSRQVLIRTWLGDRLESKSAVNQATSQIKD